MTLAKVKTTTQVLVNSPCTTQILIGLFKKPCSIVDRPLLGRLVPEYLYPFPSLYLTQPQYQSSWNDMTRFPKEYKSLLYPRSKPSPRRKEEREQTTKWKEQKSGRKNKGRKKLDLRKPRKTLETYQNKT